MPSCRSGIKDRALRPATAYSQRRRNVAALCLAAGMVQFAAVRARAATENWTASSSDWNTPGNWSGNSVPSGGDVVTINTNDANTDIINYDYPGPAVTLSSLTINDGGGGLDELSMQIAGLTLAGGVETIGQGGAALVMQSAGLNAASTMRLFDGGSYTLSQIGTLSAGVSELVDTGAGMEQDGGLNSIHSSLVLSSETNTSDDYLLTAGSLSIGFGQYVGYIGTGSFTQSGGTVSTTNLDLGFGAGAVGTYALGPGGILSASSTGYIGYGGTGSFTQTGGSASFAAVLELGANPGSFGNYSLTGGMLSGGTEYIGFGSSGTFTQSNGTNYLAGGSSLYLGYLAGTTGTYTLSNAGTLNVTSSEFIGYGTSGAASGSFVQSGGMNMLSGGLGDLALANSAGSNASYNFSGGTLSLIAAATLEQIGLFGTAVFTQTAGMNSSAGLGESVGIYSGGIGTYNQSGGVNLMGSTTSNLSLGYNAGATGNYNLSGGVLDAANIYVGGSPGSSGGTGTLTVTGAGQVFVAGSLVLYNTASSIQVNGGSVSATTANLNGPYTQTAGSSAFNQIIGNGNVSISGGRVTLNSGGGASALNTLSITNGGAMDLTNNSLAINYLPGSDPITTIVSYLATGYNSGTWTGADLTSSTAAAKPRVFSLGYLDSTDIGGHANQVLVKFTLAGDTNLDGRVNFSDFATLIANYGKTGLDWSQGNFSYNTANAVNFSDFAQIIANYGKTVASASSSAPPGGIIPLARSAEFQDPSQVQSPNVSVVPEPTSGMLALAAAGLLSRRKRKA